METKNLSRWNVLWLVGILSVLGWHMGHSFAQSPTDVQIVSGSYVSTVSSAIPQSHWASTVANAKLNLKAERLPNPAAAKSALEAATFQLQNFLSSANDDRFANWLHFLHWNELHQELSEAEPDLDILVQLERNMRQNYLGLEMRPFVQVRDRLSDYIDALRFGSAPTETIDILGKRLDQLSESLQIPAVGADTERQRDIGLIASFLSKSNQLPDLTQTVRSQFSRPNVRVLISSEFAGRQFSRPVSQPNPVNEVILGTQIRGQSFMSGNVTPQLLDNPQNASVRLQLSGQMNSQNIGTNRGVRIHTLGDSSISASETITLTDTGLISQNDTSVYAPLQTQIIGIEHRMRIVRKIASKKAAQQKPQADAIARGRLETRVSDQFHQQLQAQLAQTNPKMASLHLPVLDRLGLSRPQRTSWSSGQYLSLLWKQQESEQLAAPASCPLIVQPHGVTVQLHQSAIMNTLDPVIGGRIIRSVELDDYANQAGLEPSQDLNAEAGGEKWSVTMASYHPVEVEFDDQLVRFRIRTTKLDRGDQALEQPATIEATYRVVLTGGAIQFERQGDVKIEFSGRDQRGIRAVSLRGFLKNKFDTVFKPQLLDKPIRPTDRLPANAPPMTITDIQVDDGWIQATLM